MAILSLTKLYDLLTTKVGRDVAEHVTIYIEDKVRDEVASKSQVLATKEDLGLVKQDLWLVKDDLTKEISRLDIKISGTKSELIKWMFVFWVAQVASTFGFILLFLKK